MLDYLDKLWGLLKLSGWQLLMIGLAAFIALWLLGPLFGSGIALALTMLGLFAIALALAVLFSWVGSPESLPYRKITSWWNHRAERKRFRRHMPLLTGEERQILGYLLEHSHRTFETDVSGELASGLVALGFARFVTAPGQGFTQMRRVVEIPEHIWEIVVENKDQFPHKPRLSPGGREVFPWKRHWTAR